MELSELSDIAEGNPKYRSIARADNNVGHQIIGTLEPTKMISPPFTNSIRSTCGLVGKPPAGDDWRLAFGAAAIVLSQLLIAASPFIYGVHERLLGCCFHPRHMRCVDRDCLSDRFMVRSWLRQVEGKLKLYHLFWL